MPIRTDPGLAQSTRHLFFADGFEYFALGPEIHRARIESPITRTGIRADHRFWWYAHCEPQLRALLGGSPAAAAGAPRKDV